MIAKIEDSWVFAMSFCGYLMVRLQTSTSSESFQPVWNDQINAWC